MKPLNWQSKATVHKVIFTKNATKRLIEHARYIFEQTQNVDLADTYLDKIKSYIVETLSRFPQAGRPAEDLAPNTRKLVYQGFSIIYRISNEQIEILTIYRENLP